MNDKEHIEHSHGEPEKSTSALAIDSRGLHPEFLVGIGASAGGIEATRELIAHLPQANGKASYVICQHLSPNHSSMLVDILGREARMPVESVRHDASIKAGCIYVTPPNCHVEIAEGRFVLSAPEKEAFPKPSIDRLFNSIAQEYGVASVGVILSGSGSDGAVGATAIRTCGGTNIVQSPDSCKYESMPQAAISTGMIDLVAELSEIGDALQRLYAQNANKQLVSAKSKAYNQILQIIQQHTDIDLFGYKQNTINRRMKRRMAIQGIDSIEQYAQYLKENANEITAFVQDSFIVVTEFFRDPDAYQSLKQIITAQVANMGSALEFRVWCVGCATGEEAYSIAMILEELILESERPFTYKIFATDISKYAVDQARKGDYLIDQTQNIPNALLEKYFDKHEKVYSAKRILRDHIVFSVHNVLADPPFSKIQMITCRNLLIYLNEYLQDHIVSVFHFSLADNGNLFLGSTEAIKNNEFFDPVDRKHRIYRKNNDQNSPPKVYPLNRNSLPMLDGKRIRKKQSSIEDVLYAYLAKNFAPPTLVLNEDDDIIFSSGDIEPFLMRHEGMSTLNIHALIVEDMRAELKALIFKSRRLMASVDGSNYSIADRVSGEEVKVSLRISPYNNQVNRWLNVSFVPSMEVETDLRQVLKGDSEAVVLLKNELSNTRDNLQTVVEELETSNEQLQVYVEELQASNEEYQSSNEELQTVNEELQSTNEELLTVNDELIERTLVQEQLTNDIVNIQESLELPLFIVNKDFRIKVFTRSCSMVANVSKVKIDDIVFAIDWHTQIDGFRKLLTEVMDQGVNQAIEVVIDEKFYHCRVSPYKNQYMEIEGLTIIFYETTDFKRTLSALNEEKHTAQAMLNSISDGVIQLNSKSEIQFLNPAAQRMLHWDQDAAKGMSINQVFVVYRNSQHIDVANSIDKAFDDVSENFPNNSDGLLKTRKGSDVLIEYTVSPLSDSSQEQAALVVFRDVTKRQSHINQIIWNSKHDNLTGLINRDEVERRIEQAIVSAKRHHTRATFLYLDLDQFKIVNDTCGHLAGDQLLKQVAETIHQSIRSRDTVARLGGDEFAVLLEQCALVDAEATANKILHAVSELRFAWDDHLFRVGVSIGMVEINEHTSQVNDVLSDADSACYIAKDQGRNRIQMHTMDEKTLEQQRLHMRTIADITDAIETDSFRLYFQEVKQANSSGESIYEVLVRMFNKRGEFLMPESFLPAAERFGLVARIDLWVLNNTLRQMGGFKQYRDRFDIPQLNINIAAETLGSEQYLASLEQGLASYQIEPQKLCFEIQETAAVRNSVKAKVFINRVRSIGCKVALDDFGMGMSALTSLRDLPLDYVKIDQSFIDNLVSDPISQSVVRSVTEVCSLLKIGVIAEGIENEQQLTAATRLNVNAWQGFYNAKPVPLEEFISSLNRGENA